MKNTQVIINHSFGQNEEEESKNYWANIPFESYKKHQKWSDFIAHEIITLNPMKVFEFGCNAGKNLLAIKKIKPDLFCSGIDINAKAIEFGRTEFKLPLSVGDQRTLDIIPDSAFDISYTVSVLDHVPKPDNILKNLGRISRKAVLLLEPFTGEEGKVIRNTNRLTGEWQDTTPFSYSWDYSKLVTNILPDCKLEVKDYPLESNLGRFYKLYKIIRQSI